MSVLIWISSSAQNQHGGTATFQIETMLLSFDYVSGSLILWQVLENVKLSSCEVKLRLCIVSPSHETEPSLFQIQRLICFYSWMTANQSITRLHSLLFSNFVLIIAGACKTDSFRRRQSPETRHVISYSSWYGVLRIVDLCYVTSVDANY